MKITAAEAARLISGAGLARAAAKRDNPEDWLSTALNQWLDLPEVKIRGVAFHVPNEQPSKARAGRNRWIGVKAGVADWIFTGPPLVAIELKIHPNKPTKAQAKWGEELEAAWGEMTTGELYGSLRLSRGPQERSGGGLLRAIFAPRYVVAETLGAVVGALSDAGVLLEPEYGVATADSLRRVRNWFAVEHGREIP